MSQLRTEVAAAMTGPLAVDNDGWRVGRFRFAPDFIGFQGHFPEFPIVPAIVQVLAAQQVAETGLDGSLRFGAVENAKFLLQIRPDQEITVRCRLKPRDGKTLAECKLLCTGETAATFTLEFSRQD
ncbi:3-hydroxyacyl-ACP dehydratase FabZ family protein [Geoalkalibacter halelectricus]|uniref:ApeI dehydratase-like domain-containing protein n=1 Tax=Geoalkalibacter halelectricus TaxID=2847045 RepID=A0ABY5ZMY9_9BACT|nr:hypothetical protein [Geoalkalibacter halelectricus]MDO3379816.1 hypothetical protein [Geoalkalibacter halelectricus]UWZ79250.1 hypothetical protein L9S41_16440 [Geoalkalibacter halelectricus]